MKSAICNICLPFISLVLLLNSWHQEDGFQYVSSIYYATALPVGSTKQNQKEGSWFMALRWGSVTCLPESLGKRQDRGDNHGKWPRWCPVDGVFPKTVLTTLNFSLDENWSQMPPNPLSSWVWALEEDWRMAWALRKRRRWTTTRVSTPTIQDDTASFWVLSA